MEVQIADINGTVVRVLTAVGEFSGDWCSAPPRILGKYVVELDSDEILTVGSIKSLASYNDPSIENSECGVEITGFVEEVEDDVMILRLEKSLIMLQVSSNTDFIQYTGRYICVKLSRVKLYDIGL